MMEGYHCSEEHTAPSAVCMLLEMCSFETLETYLIAGNIRNIAE
jgi:hypothetical protein